MFVGSSYCFAAIILCKYDLFSVYTVLLDIDSASAVITRAFSNIGNTDLTRDALIIDQKCRL